ncbi:pentatricopeptide repeat-containing protein At1g34160-like [Aristolochia californica]|uniref:pentatricopeptide repeat-containing protein At1g34160-like n=1 Tax=Aristolochia californica TaxID=171875 RepID=UPI0035E39D50
MALVDSFLHKCKALKHIKQLQAHLIVSSAFDNSLGRIKLLDFCAVSPIGDLGYAVEVFHRIETPHTNEWNAIIRGFAQSDDPKRAIECYVSMCQQACRPDALTCSFALKACARMLGLFEGREIHGQFIRFGFEADVLLQTTVIDLYAKCGHLDQAQQLFDEMPRRDVPTWNALITGLAQGSRPRDALSLFNQMRGSGVVPNEITVIGALSACSQLGGASEGNSVHGYISEARFDTNTRVCNALIDMYAKCGSIDLACDVFNQMVDRSLVSWNAIIMGLAMHGRGVKAVELFNQMSSSGVQPDAVTYLAALCACNHAGLVDDGLRIFKQMTRNGVIHNVKHYGCVVDLLGRAGRLLEAHMMIKSMPLVPDAVLWQTLLGACNTYGNIELAELASEKLREMGSASDGDYVIMSNVYAAYGRWEDVGRVREAMKINDVRKMPGCSFIEVEGILHSFLNGDQTHLKSKEIYSKLDEISIRIKSLGYAPRTWFVLHDIGEEEKENVLLYHSEKLAMAYGLICMNEGGLIQVYKNLRICGDCHIVFKLVSKIYEREIVVRDRSRFHRFKGGFCSCGDYW